MEENYTYYIFDTSEGKRANTNYEDFKCIGNPLEHLIYKDEYFTKNLYENLKSKLFHEIYDDYLDYRLKGVSQFIDYSKIEFFNDYQNEDALTMRHIEELVESDVCKFAPIIFNYISKLKIDKLSNSFEAQEYPRCIDIGLLDEYKVHILPIPTYSNHVYKDRMTLLKNWGFSK